MPRLILTLAQARTIQAQDWPGPYKEILKTPVPEQPDNTLDGKRTLAGLQMLEMGCTDEQIALQLMFKEDGSALRQLHRMQKRAKPA